MHSLQASALPPAPGWLRRKVAAAAHEPLPRELGGSYQWEVEVAGAGGFRYAGNELVWKLKLSGCLQGAGW
jgi:hypothetical protein